MSRTIHHTRYLTFAEIEAFRARLRRPCAPWARSSSGFSPAELAWFRKPLNGGGL